MSEEGAAVDTSGATETTTTTETTQSAETADVSQAGSLFEGHESNDSGELILGRFKDQDALESDWKRQNDIIRDRVKELPDENIIDIALQRELHTKLGDDAVRQLAEDRGMLQEVPESYDLDAAMQSVGITPAGYDNAKEAYDETAAVLKEGRFTEEQLKIGMGFLRAELAKQAEAFFPQVDRDKEVADLKGAWGKQTQQRGARVTAWAKANLSSDVFNKPLASTAEGMKLLYRMMQEDAGAQPISGETTSSVDPLAIEKELRQLMESDAYTNRHHPDHNVVHERSDQLVKQQMHRK